MKMTGYSDGGMKLDFFHNSVMEYKKRYGRYTRPVKSLMDAFEGITVLATEVLSHMPQKSGGGLHLDQGLVGMPLRIELC